MIWLIGNKGMLGQELCLELKKAGLPNVGSDREVSILEFEVLKVFAEKHHPDIIINCSAYTAVDQAEEDADAAYAINKDGVANIADLAASLNIPLIHISTDYVFDGSSSIPLDEEASTKPVGVYGASKLAGEEEIRSRCRKYFIIRTAWLYGQYGANFVYTMIKLMNKLESLKVVDDQIGSPTWTRELIGLICKIASGYYSDYGTYHLSGEGECSWYGFASEIYRVAREKCLINSDCLLNPCSSEEFPTVAKRPAFSLMSKEKIKKTFSYIPSNWKDALESFLEGITSDDII